MQLVTPGKRRGLCWYSAVLWVLLLGQSAAAKLPFGQGILFSLSKTGVAPSHVFGTIHSDDVRVTNLPEPVRRALEVADRVAVEVVLDETLLLLSATALVFADGRNLPMVLDDELYGRTAAAVESLGIPEIALRQFKPWAVVTMLSVPPAKTGQFLDLMLYSTVRARGIEVIGLESVSEQLSLFDNLADQEQIELLKETLKNLDRLPLVFENLIQTYLKRDLAGLVRISEDLAKYGDTELGVKFQEKLIDSRNERMVERMLPLLEQGDLFVGVGALHLPGQKGILFILERLGYSVDRVY